MESDSLGGTIRAPADELSSPESGDDMAEAESAVQHEVMNDASMVKGLAVCTPPPMLMEHHPSASPGALEDDDSSRSANGEIGASPSPDYRWAAMAATPPLLDAIGEDDPGDDDFVFITQTTRKLSLPEAIRNVNARTSAPSAPPLHILSEVDEYSNSYSDALLARANDSTMMPVNDEIFRILTDFEGSQALLDGVSARLKSLRDAITKLNEDAWRLEHKMLVAEENGDVRAVPYEREQSWSSKIVESLKRKLMSQEDDSASSIEGSLLIAWLVPQMMKEKESKKAELRHAVDELADRAFVASVKRHRAIECVRVALADSDSLRSTCDALMHYENRDRDVCFVSKAIRQLLVWVVGCLLEGEDDELDRLRNQIWLIRRAKFYALKNPPRLLSRVAEVVDTKGTTAQWAHHDWVDRWMIILEGITERSSLDPSPALARSVSGLKEVSDLQSTMMVQVEQDEEVLVALLSNFPFEAGLQRLLSKEHRDLQRLMSRSWQILETMGEACSRSKIACPRFSAELASRLCLLIKGLAAQLDDGLPQEFYDRLVLRTVIFLLDRGSMFDTSSWLEHISDRAAWLLLSATMSFARVDAEFDMAEKNGATSNERPDAIFSDLADYRIVSPPRQNLAAHDLEEWLEIAPFVRANFSNSDTHLARCTFLAKLAKAKGGSFASVVVRELLGLAYMASFVPCDVVNPLLCEIAEQQTHVCSVILQVVALNDAAFFERPDDAVQQLFGPLRCSTWEPRGESDIRFFRDWLGRDPADPRALIACELLERLSLSTLPLDLSRSLARMLAMVSVTEPTSAQGNESIVYHKTLRPFRKSRLIERFWNIVLSLRLDSRTQDSASPRSGETQDSGDAVDADVEFLQHTFRRNSSHPLLAFVVGIITADSDCLITVLTSGRASAVWQLSRVISRVVIGYIPRGEFEEAMRDSRLAALRAALQFDEVEFVRQVVEPEMVGAVEVQALQLWLEIASNSNVVFVDRILRLVDSFNVSPDALSRFQSHATMTTPRLMVQFLLDRTERQMTLWFSLGRVLLDGSEALALNDIFENADRVLPDLLRLAGMHDSYISPSKLVLFEWVDAVLSLNADDDASCLFGVMSQVLFSLLFSKVDDIPFGHVLWILAPKKRLALVAKLKELAGHFHEQASMPGLTTKSRSELMSLGEIAHEGSEEWLKINPPLPSVPALAQSILVFSENSRRIAFDRLIRRPWITSAPPSTVPGEPIAPASGDEAPAPSMPSSPRDSLGHDPRAGGQDHPSNAKSLSSRAFASQFGVMAQTIDVKRRSLVSLLRRCAASIVDCRVRLAELDAQETQQFTSLFRPQAKTCSVLIDRLYSGDSAKAEAAKTTGSKKKHGQGGGVKRAQVTHATWTVFERDQGMVAAHKMTETHKRSEVDSLLSRLAPGSASEELCDALSLANQVFAEDRPEADDLLRELLEFDTSQLCSCNALRDAWVQVLGSGISWANSKGLAAQTSLFLLDAMLRQPWTIKYLQHLLEIQSSQVVEAFAKFASQCVTLETNDALLLLRRLEVVEPRSDDQVTQILGMVLVIFGKRRCDVKIMDQLKRGVLRNALARRLRCDPLGLQEVVRALIAGGEDGGPLPGMVWAEVSSVPDGIWRVVPESLARTVLDELGLAFGRVLDRHSLIPSWVSLAPNLCRRARSLQSILQPWSPWVLSAAGRSSAPHPDEEDPLVNCFVACLLRLIEDLDENATAVSDVLLGTWLWYVQGSCASRTSARLVRGLLRLPWQRMIVSASQVDDIVSSMERLRTHIMALPSRLADEVASESLMNTVLEHARAEASAADVGRFPEDLLGRAFALGLRLASDARVHRLLLSLPFSELSTSDFSAGLELCLESEMTSSKDGMDWDSRISARVQFVLAVASQRQQNRPEKAMELALVITRFVFSHLVGANTVSFAVTIKLFHACLSFVRVCFADLNGDLESSVVREMLAFLRTESDQVFGFCFSKTIRGGLGQSATDEGANRTTGSASAAVTNSVGYISVVARSFLPTFLKQDISANDREDEESWSDDWKHVYTATIAEVCGVSVIRKANPGLAGCGAVLWLFASGKAIAGLFAREASTMPQIQDRALARILNELARHYDLRDLSERCESIVNAALATGSAIVATGALHRRAPGFDRVSVGSTYVASLDFRFAGRDACFLLAEVARNLASNNSSSLSRSYKIDRALFLSSRLEQVMPTLENPRQRLAVAACADAFRFCCTKTDLAFSALDSAGLRGSEVEWVKANAVLVEFDSLYKFIDQLRFLLWPTSALIVTKLTAVDDVTASLTIAGDDGEIVAL